MCAHHRTANRLSSASGANAPRSGPASAADMNAPGWSPCAAISKTSARSSVATTPPIIARMTSASRLNVRRRGFVTSRRKNAQPIDTQDDDRDDVLHRADERPEQAVERHREDLLDDPPVTMLAVPTVSRTKPQKIPRASAGRASLNILVWMNAYSIRPTNRARDVGERARALRADRREDAQVAGHREHEQRAGAPEDEEDERIGGNVDERARTASSSGVGLVGGSASWSNGPARVSSACRAPARAPRATRARRAGCPAR